jgi:murein DD-endopeptidase MepM/ murein hydrolase activator NlpD
LFVFGSKHISTPKEKSLVSELDQMEVKYAELSVQMNKVSTVLDNVQDRDASVHRMIFGMEPIDNQTWNGGIGGHDKYEDLTQFKNSGELMRNVSSTLDKIKYQLAIQSKSLDTLEKQAIAKEKELASIPSIKPIREDKLARRVKLLSGYGMRIHPIHKIRKMHEGIDFTAPRGTPIQATGDGIVAEVKKSKRGYGNSVLIDHGYGYKTLYAHMEKYIVKKGQRVKKGEKIGTVGNTGSSTAPHCHYEVIKNNKKINPIQFVMDGLTPMEYQELIALAGKQNQSFD